MKQAQESKFKAGDLVYEKHNTTNKMVVKKALDGIYFCIIENDLKRKEHVFFERELISATA